MDKFEKQLRRNKSSFETKASNKEMIWDNIDKALVNTQSDQRSDGVSDRSAESLGTSMSHRYKILFLLLAFSVLGFLAGKFFNPQQEESQHYASDQSIEFLEINRHYKKMVSYQVEQLESNTELDEMEKREFLHYIDQLDGEQENLKDELRKNIDNQEVLEAIIKNFQQQINLIDELLDRVDRAKNVKYEIGISL